MNLRAPVTTEIRDCRGVAIVVVLWVVMVLSLLISGFAFTMHVETQLAAYARKELKAEMLARSGIEVAKMQLLLHQQEAGDAGFDALNQDWATNEDLFVDHELGEGKFNVKITDEESKMPVNIATELQLQRLMTLLNVDPSDGDIIVDSIMDWREPGDLHRLNGAKSDYYLSLLPPYRAKNGPLDRVDELLLVRGVTPELYHGTPATDKDPAQPGFADVFTTMSSGQINVNTASAIVLQAMLGLSDVQVQAILARRDGPDGIPGTDDDLPFHTPAEFFATAGTLDPVSQQADQGLVAVSSSFFTIKSTGEVGGVKHTILATVRRDGGNLQTVMWRETREAS
ncbi:MAG TPA: type II secretion system minor pseudopilin GspK [Verrucomicrobiae bacterium]|nr:type II secretion system minor pseudopilin GspK [Verrucomicrobiae bacterium]